MGPTDREPMPQAQERATYMTVSPDGGRDAISRATEVSFDDQSITWSGEFPWVGSIAFATEEGWLRILRGQGPSLGVRLSGLSDTINDVCFATHPNLPLLAVSTRVEVTYYLWPNQDSNPVLTFRLDGGAHGVFQTIRGGIAATLGPGGLMIVNADRQHGYVTKILKPNADAYFYRIAPLACLDDGSELLAGAGRLGGLMSIVVGDGERLNTLGSFRGPSLDIVDVCSLRDHDNPFGAASLGIDCSVHLTRDLLGSAQPVTLRFSQVEGVGYSIHCVGGHIFMLTSQGLYACPDLARRFARGEELEGPSRVRHITLDAVHCSVAYHGLPEFESPLLLIVSPPTASMLPVGQVIPDAQARIAQANRSHQIGIDESMMISLISRDRWDLTAPCEMEAVTLAI